QKLKSVWDRICKVASPQDFVLHCTSEEEADESIERIPGVQTVVIPNAVEIPEQICRKPNGDRLRFLYLGRHDPKKAIENLLHALQILTGDRPHPPECPSARSGDAADCEWLRGCSASHYTEGRVSLNGTVEEGAEAHLIEDVNGKAAGAVSGALRVEIADARA